jgi:hypothetical protein
MQKKLFLQRNIRKRGASTNSPLKYLVVAAVCLLVLVLITSIVFRDKGKEIPKRPMPDRATVTKEVPKTPEPATARRVEVSVKPEPVKPQVEKPVATTPEPVAPPEVKNLPKPPEPDVNPVAQKEAAPEVISPPAPAPEVEPGPKDLFPKKSSPIAAPISSPPVPTPKEPIKPAEKRAAQKPAANPTLKTAEKPSAPAGNRDYAVKVGATFKTKSEAETLRRDLAKKGYTALVRPAKKGPGYDVTTSPTVASKAYTLQEQLKIQGVNTTTVIKVNPTPEPAKKPKPQKSKTGQSKSALPGSDDE